MINLGVDETMLHFSNEFELKLKKNHYKKCLLGSLVNCEYG